jgi:hypothetical protein
LLERYQCSNCYQFSNLGDFDVTSRGRICPFCDALLIRKVEEPLSEEIAVCICGASYSDSELGALGRHLLTNPTHKWIDMTRRNYVKNYVSKGRIRA